MENGLLIFDKYGIYQYNTKEYNFIKENERELDQFFIITSHYENGIPKYVLYNRTFKGYLNYATDEYEKTTIAVTLSALLLGAALFNKFLNNLMHP